VSCHSAFTQIEKLTDLLKCSKRDNSNIQIGNVFILIHQKLFKNDMNMSYQISCYHMQHLQGINHVQ